MELWRIKHDLISLFTRNIDHLKPIDGLRSLTCLMLITVHILGFLDAFIQPHPHPDWLNYVGSVSFSLTGLFTYSLEIFFMLSGFLMTKKYLNLLEITKNNKDFFREYFVQIIRRVCRYWPGIALAWLMLFLLGEPNGNFMSVCLFYQNYFDIDHWSISVFPLWSISLDMQMHVVMPIVLYMVHYFRNLISKASSFYFLVILSIGYGILTFDPTTMNVYKLASQHNSLSLLLSESNEQWIKSYFNFTFRFEPIHPSPLKPFMQFMYLPLPSRYASFIIGGILALKLKDVTETRCTGFDTIKKYFCFILTWLYIVTFILPRTQLSIDDWIITILISIGRQIFATTQAFLLFSTLSPVKHRYHSSWMKIVLSLPIWSPVAKLSYLIYAVHYRIVLELVMGARWFSLEHYTVGCAAVLYLILVFSICLPIALAWYIFVDKPFERFLAHIIFIRKSHQKSSLQ